MEIILAFVGMVVIGVVAMIIAEFIFRVITRIIWPPRISRLLMRCHRFPESREFK